ncbi:PAS domain S-box protein [Flavobacterium sp.]|uniref:PAS domain S-box protein n=1 Tax=Flavobacterium sp. TaxID=239 RepID=UPI0037C17873
MQLYLTMSQYAQNIAMLNPNLKWIFSFAFICIIGITFILNKKNKKQYANYIKKYYQLKYNSDKYGASIFFLGFLIVLTEIIYSFYDLRPETLAIINFSIGFTLLLLYLFIKKIPFLVKNIRVIFTFIYILYLLFEFNNLVTREFNLITYSAFLLIVYFSFTIYKTLKEFIFFHTFLGFLYLYTFTQHLISDKLALIIVISSILIAFVNYLRYLSIITNTENILYASSIDDKNNSLSIAINTKSEVIYCSESITKILGYYPEQVIGKNFWILTENSEKNFTKKIENKIYVRKLKCADGKFKYIQWTDKIFSDDTIVSIGKDITQYQQIHNQYNNVIENATDLIFETDKDGNFTYLNKFVQESLGYTLEETINQHYSKFIRKDHIKKASEFLKNYLNSKEIIKQAFDYPIIKKNGEAIWLSQKISINRNDEGIITGYSAIARDITILKKLEIEKKYKEIKVKKYDDFKNELTLKSFSSNVDFKSFLIFILKSITKIVDINRVSYWEYYPDKIVCTKLYEQNTDTFQYNMILYKKDYPTYFETIEKKHIIVASDVYKKKALKEFIPVYFPETQIKSMLDTSIYLNGDLKGVLCLESNTKIKIWDTEDINFVQSISDFIAIFIETNHRLETEKKVKYKSELLSALTKITNSFIKNKNIFSNCNETLAIIGKAARVDRAYFYLNDAENQIVIQKYEWVCDTIKTFIDAEAIISFPHENFREYIELLKINKSFNFIVKNIEDEIYKQSLVEKNIKSIINIPIFIKNELYGFIGFDDCTNERIWSEDEINILQNLANNITSAIERNESDNLVTETEERFKLLAENIPGTVYLSKNDPNFTKVYINDEIENLTGFPKSDFLENKIVYSNLIHPNEKDDVVENQKNAIKEGRKIHQVYRIYNKAGKIVWVEEFGDVIKKDSKIEYIEGIFIDITNRKKNEKAVEKRLLAEAANKAKSDFLANMSHEIRTPLNGIIGFTDLLKNITLEKTQLNYMETISQSANLLMEIINDILDFSKIESGKLDLNISESDIRELSNQVIILVKYEAIKKDLNLSFSVDENIPKYIFTDSIRLKQIVINLLSNAIKFTKTGSVHFSINLLEKTKNSNFKLRFSVKDTGVGIKEEYIDKIFDAFSQGDNSTTRKFGGTGLGLTISNQLLSLMKSKLQINSIYKEGSEFFFEITFKGSESIKNKALILKPIENTETKKTIDFGQENYKILIVEDNKINMLLAKTLVKQIIPNATVYDAINGKEAVKKFSILKPDLILMDVEMPVMNGYQATQEIRKMSFGTLVPIIAITAGIVIGEKEKCLNVGMNDYASKPIVKDTLQTIISKWIRI